MAVDIYLNFKGNCREAVNFYAKVFGCDTPQIMTYGEAPPHPEFPMPEEAKNMVLFTRLNIRGSNVMFSDTAPGLPFVAGNNINLTLNSKSKEEMQSLFNSLKESGCVTMDLQETFWSKYYGMLTDKFGIPWQFNYESE